MQPLIKITACSASLQMIIKVHVTLHTDNAHHLITTAASADEVEYIIIWKSKISKGK
jgi:hypothetical protein